MYKRIEVIASVEWKYKIIIHHKCQPLEYLATIHKIILMNPLADFAAYVSPFYTV